MRQTGEADFGPLLLFCALFLSMLRLGVLGKARLCYWKFVLSSATRYRRTFGAAMTLAVMGNHFQRMTERIVDGEI